MILKYFFLFLNEKNVVLYMCRVATVREKYLENEFFPGQGKVREFCGWPGKFRKDLESQGKVREFEKKGHGRQSSENLFCSRWERMYFLRDSLSPSPSSFGGTLKEKNLLLWGANSYL